MQSKTDNGLGLVKGYVQVARPDHWFKNVFMLPGFVLAIFYVPDLFRWESLPAFITAVVSTCIVASSNYTLNEITDARSDRLHPVKHLRPAAMGRINIAAGITQWLLLGVLGIGLGSSLNSSFAWTLSVFWLMGCIYNIPPVRCKDVPYIDVLCESANNPIRLALGWYALIPDLFPPLSILLVFWMVGAFFMTAKRYAEYQNIGDPHRARQYRKSFGHYNENRLLISMFFYTAAGALFCGIFIVRYKLELVLSIPLIAGCFAYYLRLSLHEYSPVQNPEMLMREKGLIAYLSLTVLFMIMLMFLDIPGMYELFNVAPYSFEPLWRIGN